MPGDTRHGTPWRWRWSSADPRPRSVNWPSRPRYDRPRSWCCRHPAAVAAGLECRAGPGSTAGRRSAFMEVRDYIEDNAEGFFEALKEWLAIPSISADPDHHDDVRASAEWLAARLRGTGFPVVEIWETGAAADHGEPRERIGQNEPRERIGQSQPRERSEQSQPGLPAVFAHWPADRTSVVSGQS